MLSLSWASLSLSETPSCQEQFQPASGSFDFVNAKTPPDLAGQIGAIHFTGLPVFDEENPRENSVLFRWANKFHITTARTWSPTRSCLVQENPMTKDY